MKKISNNILLLIVFGILTASLISVFIRSQQHASSCLSELNQTAMSESYATVTEELEYFRLLQKQLGEEIHLHADQSLDGFITNCSSLSKIEWIHIPSKSSVQLKRIEKGFEKSVGRLQTIKFPIRGWVSIEKRASYLPYEGTLITEIYDYEHHLVGFIKGYYRLDFLSNTIENFQKKRIYLSISKTDNTKTQRAIPYTNGLSLELYNSEQTLFSARNFYLPIILSISLSTMIFLLLLISVLRKHFLLSKKRTLQGLSSTLSAFFLVALLSLASFMNSNTILSKKESLLDKETLLSKVCIPTHIQVDSVHSLSSNTLLVKAMVKQVYLDNQPVSNLLVSNLEGHEILHKRVRKVSEKHERNEKWITWDLELYTKTVKSMHNFPFDERSFNINVQPESSDLLFTTIKSSSLPRILDGWKMTESSISSSLDGLDISFKWKRNLSQFLSPYTLTLLFLFMALFCFLIVPCEWLQSMKYESICILLFLFIFSFSFHMMFRIHQSIYGISLFETFYFAIYIWIVYLLSYFRRFSNNQRYRSIEKLCYFYWPINLAVALFLYVGPMFFSTFFL